MSLLYEVLLPNRLSHTLTYSIPDSLAPEAFPGKRVLVPLGTKQVIGSLFRISEAAPPKGLKPILEILDETPTLSSSQLKLIDFASRYYLTPIGEVYRHCLPLSLFKRKSISERPVKSLKGNLPKAAAISDYELPQLTTLQEGVIQAILKNKKNTLLHGITGSGKTEVYIRLTREVLQQGGSALILLPEIGLTPQIVERFAKSLPVDVAVYHSGLNPAQRAREWQRIHRGETRVVVGTRSALFLPLQELRLIVIDEEHDASFKQEERFCYHARDLALWRGQEEKALVVLGSATPSLESLHRARMGKLLYLRLNERPSGATRPAIELIDRRLRPSFTVSNASSFLSAELLQALEVTLKRKEQALIFLNRRGYAPSLICPSCGFSPRCEGCDIALTWHKNFGKLLCHYCDRTIPYSSRCPQCQIPSLVPQGGGTEKIEEELQQHFRRARLARLDRDITAKKGWQEILEKMRGREVDILIGTQMITKGHDYPFLTLVGIIDADVALNLPDFRAAERTYQLVLQVAGRAGRKDRPGRVLVQTRHPEHPALRAAQQGSELEFIEAELQQREAAGYPPFRRLIQIRFSGRQDRVIQAAEKSAVKLAPLSRLMELLGPAPCPIEKVRGQYRWHLLLKTSQFTKLHPHLTRILEELERGGLPSSVRMLVNVDPVDMM